VHKRELCAVWHGLRRGDLRAEDTDSFLLAVLLVAVVRRAGMDKSAHFFNVVGPTVPLSSRSASALDSALLMMVLERVSSSYMAKPGQLTWPNQASLWFWVANCYYY